MNVRHLTKAAAIVALVASPVAAQAANSNVAGPQRASSSIEQGSEMRSSSWVIGILALAAIIAAIIIAAKDDNDPVSP